MITTTHQMILKKNHTSGFSLVEVTMALAILAFAGTSMISLIPLGLTSFRQAMNNTVEAEIIQSMINNITLTNFGNLKSMASSQGTIYYFDSEGEPVTSAASSLYKVQISFTDLSSGSISSSPVGALTQSSGTTALITITKIDKTKDYYSVVVGNNQQVETDSTAATW